MYFTTNFFSVGMPGIAVIVVTILFVVILFFYQLTKHTARIKKTGNIFYPSLVILAVVFLFSMIAAYFV